MIPIPNPICYVGAHTLNIMEPMYPIDNPIAKLIMTNIKRDLFL